MKMKNEEMKRFNHPTNLRLSGMVVRVLMALLISHFSFLIPVKAQSFTERIQKGTAGQPTVTIHQSADIDQLVNSATLTTTAATRPASSGNTTGNANASASHSTTKPVGTTSAEQETEPVDLSKKVIRNGVKVNGDRVQAFAGGNSRKDRQQAEQIGNTIKAHFGNVPVYVHFYSPRWICRVGNYRTYEEAHQMLQNLRKLGYNQASIVKGKITVQY